MVGKILVGLAAAGMLAGVVATGAMAAPASTAAATPKPNQQAPKPQAAKDVFGGIVTAINETAVTVKNAKAGSKTFLRNSDTVVMKAGKQKSNWSEIEANSHVRIRYQDKGGKLYATRVRIGRPHVAGTVQSVNGNTIMLRTRDGKDVRLTVNGDTKYFKVIAKKQRQAGSLSEIHAGTRLIAAGSYDSSHNFDAALVAYRNK